jgi:hypothetical protein
MAILRCKGPCVTCLLRHSTCSKSIVAFGATLSAAERRNTSHLLYRYCRVVRCSTLLRISQGKAKAPNARLHTGTTQMPLQRRVEC